MEELGSRSRCRRIADNCSSDQNVVTEGDRQLKKLVEKQTKTDVTLQGHLAMVKNFSSGSVYSMPTDDVAGLISSTEFNRLMEEGQRLNELRQCGLTDDEITLKLLLEDPDRKQVVSKRCASDIDSIAHAERMTTIANKMAVKEKELQEPTKFAGAKALSRHEMDLERAISHDRSSSKLHSFLLTEKPSDFVHPDHPINHLNSLLTEILPDVCVGKRERRKRKRLAKQSNDDRQGSDNKQSEAKQGCSYGPFVSNWTPVLPEIVAPLPSVPQKKNTEQLSKSSTELIPVEVIERYKLSLEQITQLPRFKDYSPGVPSSTLFVKNLSPRCTEDDLFSLFGHFQVGKSSVVIKLLHGKMKGQAFVTFNSVETASEAMNLINGYDFKGKPIIIEYGRKSVECADPGTTATCSAVTVAAVNSPNVTVTLADRDEVVATS